MGLNRIPWFEIILTAGLAFLLYEFSEFRTDLRRIDDRLRAVEQVQAQHSIKLDQLLAAELPVEVLARSVIH